MLVSELLFERRLQRTRIMYHGTSSSLLPSIMKFGLLPNAPVKSSYLDQPHLRSFGGVYLTSDLDIAKDGANQAIKSHGGNPILITVQYVQGSGGLDEDLVFKKFIDIGIKYINIKSKITPLQTFLANVIPEASTVFSKYAFRRYSTNTLIRNFFKELYDYLINIIQFNIKNKQFPLNFNTDEIMENEILRQIINNIIESSKEFPTTDLVRITRPVKFRGKTRISQIVNMRTGEVLYS